jgi:hypothetical protein
MSTDEYLKIIVDTGEQIQSRNELMRGVGPPYRKERGAWTAEEIEIYNDIFKAT